MDKFAIKIKETLARTVIVEAENIDEAIQKVTDAYEAGRIILDSDDYDGACIESSEYFNGGKVTDEDVSYYWHLEE